MSSGITKAVLLLRCEPEWTDRATFAFLFLSHLTNGGRDLFLKLGVGVIGQPLYNTSCKITTYTYICSLSFKAKHSKSWYLHTDIMSL
jgi:hypothetical protein